jgi:DUF4097 and DUF4098 domain-containing protein YvlB
MKFSHSICLILTTVATAPLFAGEDIDESKDASPDGLVEIINPRGEVTIRGWDENRIEIRGELDDLSEEFIFEIDGNTARIEVKIPKRGANWGDGSDLEIQVPQGSRVSFESASSDSSVSNIQGGIRFRTASGDIDARNIESQINIKTVSGDIEVRDAAGRANVSSVSGEIELELTSKRISADTVSGDLELKLASFDQLFAKAVSGDMEISGTLTSNGDIETSTVSGDIFLELIEPVDAEISIETGPGGDINNELSKDKVATRFPAMKALNTRVGEVTDGKLFLKN